MIRTVCLTLFSVVLPGLVDERFTAPFDGKSTQGWTTVGGRPDNRVVRDGLVDGIKGCPEESLPSTQSRQASACPRAAGM
jgi:hypothetical protein